MNANKIERLIKQMGSMTNEQKFIWNNDNIIMTHYVVIKLNVDKIAQIYEPMNEHLVNTFGKLESIDYDKDLPVPTVKEMKTEISNLVGRNRSQRVLYHFGDNLPTVNARYLMNLIEGLEVTEIKFNNSKSALKLIGKNGTAYLLPVHSMETSKGYRVA